MYKLLHVSFTNSNPITKNWLVFRIQSWLLTEIFIFLLDEDEEPRCTQLTNQHKGAIRAIRKVTFFEFQKFKVYNKSRNLFFKKKYIESSSVEILKTQETGTDRICSFFLVVQLIHSSAVYFVKSRKKLRTNFEQFFL